MAKQIVHIGLAVSTDGFLPGRANIINLAAVMGDLGTFNQNIAPMSGSYGVSPFWGKHPAEFEALKVGAKPLPEVMVQFRAWLRQWQGNLVACTSSMDFWHLFNAMFMTGKDCPFGSTPLDTNSYHAALEGKKTPRRLQGLVVPLEVARERWQLVTSGKMPKFGDKPPAPKLKLPRVEPGERAQSILSRLTGQTPARTTRPYRVSTTPAATLQNALADTVTFYETVRTSPPPVPRSPFLATADSGVVDYFSPEPPVEERDEDDF